MHKERTAENEKMQLAEMLACLADGEKVAAIHHFMVQNHPKAAVPQDCPLPRAKGWMVAPLMLDYVETV